MLLRIAVSMTVEPSSASTVRLAPLESLKVIFGIWKDSRNDFVVDDARLYIVIRVGKPSPVIAWIASPRSRPAPHRRPARVDRLHRRSRLGRGPRPVRWRPQPARRDPFRVCASVAIAGGALLRMRAINSSACRSSSCRTSCSRLRSLKVMRGRARYASHHYVPQLQLRPGSSHLRPRLFRGLWPDRDQIQVNKRPDGAALCRPQMRVAKAVQSDGAF